MIEQESLYLRAKKAYYSGSPIMTDSQFDLLEANLKSLGSLVIEVVGTTDEKEQPHLSPMLSLEKVHIDDMSATSDFDKAFSTWMSNRKSFLPLTENVNTFKLRCEPKYDGSSCNLIYEGGNLKFALTRGDGQMGTDITSKLKLIVPLKISILERVEIRGEVNIMTKTFETKYSQKYKNARNFVAGILGRDDNFNEVLDFHFIAFECRIHKDQIEYCDNPINLLKELGFYTPHLVREINSNEILSAVNQFFKDRYETSPFGLDGMVVKFPDKFRNFIGETSHHPKSQLAIKFPAVEAVTQIESIEWQIGQSGRFTPVGQLKGVDLDGSFVKKVSLYNWDNIVEMGLFPGAIITIVKSGDIIPCVKNVLQRVDVINPADYPKFYPIHNPHKDCSISKSGPHLICTNPLCPDKEISKLINALRIFDIENIGPANVEMLHKSGIKNIIDIFNPLKFNKQNLIRGGYFKEGRALDIILEAPLKVKEFTIPLLINSLNFENVGKRMSIEIAKVFLNETPDWTSMSFAAYSPFLNPNSNEYKLVLEFKNSIENWGYKIKKEEVKKEGIKVVLTGSPKSSGYKTKSEFLLANVHLIEAESLSDAKYLITDDLGSTSSKMIKAKKLGVNIIDYLSAKSI